MSYQYLVAVHSVYTASCSITLSDATIIKTPTGIKINPTIAKIFILLLNLSFFLYIHVGKFLSFKFYTIKTIRKAITGKTDLAVNTGCHAGNLCCLKAELSGFFDSVPATLRWRIPSPILKNYFNIYPLYISRKKIIPKVLLFNCYTTIEFY